MVIAPGENSISVAPPLVVSIEIIDVQRLSVTAFDLIGCTPFFHPSNMPSGHFASNRLSGPFNERYRANL
jgi:hypothetical protein